MSSYSLTLHFLCFSVFCVSSTGQKLHTFVSGTIGMHGPRGPTQKNVLSSVTDYRAYTSQHCALILI